MRKHNETLSVVAIVFRLREHLTFKVRRPPNDHPFSELVRLATACREMCNSSRVVFLFRLIVFLRSRTDSIPFVG
jgi:hypothetical protein